MRTVSMAPCVGCSMPIVETHGERTWDGAMRYANQQTDGLDLSEDWEAAVAQARKPFETTKIVCCRRQSDSAHRPPLRGAPG